MKAELAVLQKQLPSGLKLVYPYDTQPYIVLSLEEVVQTLLEAIALVFVVMLIFLQNFRATLIPTIAVPVVLLGTFAVLAVPALLHQHVDHAGHGAGGRPAGG